MDTAVILLAAGGSTRLGSPKQLLVYEGKTLLRRAAEVALATGCRPVIVVLGAGLVRHREELAGLDVLTVENASWESGMGGSLRAGMAALEPWPALAGVLLTLCDQPFVDAAALRNILAAAGSGYIVAATYAGTVGVPAWFSQNHFEDLRTLPPDAGAKALLRRHASSVVTVDLPQAAVDIDTREQYARLTTESHAAFGHSD